MNVGRHALKLVNDEKLAKAVDDLDYSKKKLVEVAVAIRDYIDSNYYEDSSPNIRRLMANRI